MMKAAITKRGFIWILLIGATNDPIKFTTTGTFASKNDLRMLHTVLKKRHISEVYERPFALIVTVRPFAHEFAIFRNMCILTKGPDDISQLNSIAP